MTRSKVMPSALRERDCDMRCVIQTKGVRVTVVDFTVRVEVYCTTVYSLACRSTSGWMFLFERLLVLLNHTLNTRNPLWNIKCPSELLIFVLGQKQRGFDTRLKYSTHSNTKTQIGHTDKLKLVQILKTRMAILNVEWSVASGIYCDMNMNTFNPQTVSL